MKRPFRLCTKALEAPLRSAERQDILSRRLTPAETIVFEMPIEEWRTAPREELEAFSCSVAAPCRIADVPHADASAGVLSKIGVYAGPVTNLDVDVIVNAANNACLGGGGVDGAIHRAAGHLLRRECAMHNGCATGEALITKGYNLPARYVIHTVGPVGEQPALLQSCYRSALYLAAENDLRTMGFCGISTGVYGYPLRAATRIAIDEVSHFLAANPDALDLVCFACFLDEEIRVTREELQAQGSRLAAVRER